MWHGSFKYTTYRIYGHRMHGQIGCVVNSLVIPRGFLRNKCLDLSLIWSIFAGQNHGPCIRYAVQCPPRSTSCSAPSEFVRSFVGTPAESHFLKSIPCCGAVVVGVRKRRGGRCGPFVRQVQDKLFILWYGNETMQLTTDTELQSGVRGGQWLRGNNRDRNSSLQ